MQLTTKYTDNKKQNRKVQNDMELLACIVFFILGFVIGNALPYTMLVGDWKCEHGTTVTPSDDELYKWHYKRMIKKTRKVKK